jgi:hypothetical protein
MKLLSQGRLAVVTALAGLILVALGRVPKTAEVSLAFTGAGALCLLAALGCVWGMAADFQRMLDDLQGRQTKT